MFVSGAVNWFGHMSHLRPIDMTLCLQSALRSFKAVVEPMSQLNFPSFQRDLMSFYESILITILLHTNTVQPQSILLLLLTPLWMTHFIPNFCSIFLTDNHAWGDLPNTTFYLFYLLLYLHISPISFSWWKPPLQQILLLHSACFHVWPLSLLGFTWNEWETFFLLGKRDGNDLL